MRIVKLTKESKNNILEGMLKKSNNYGSYESVVADILANIKENGDKALLNILGSLISLTLIKTTSV